MLNDLETWDPMPLRRALQRSGYTQQGLVAAGLDGVPYQGRSGVGFQARLPPGSPLAVMARLFLLDEAVPLPEVAAVLGLEVNPLLALGLLQLTEGLVRSRLQLTPLADGWFAGDFLRRHAEAPADYVMGFSPVTQLLTSLTPRLLSGSALELGCGAAWLALHLRRGGLAVTGTDICRRGLEIARFNERLAGLSGIEWLEGSWFDPVGDRQFDLIVCNPPYVQSPGGDLTYRETAPGEENPCAALLRQAVSRLKPGGFCCMVLNWSHATAEDWTEAPLSWAPAEGTQRFLFQARIQSPADYAWQWIKHDPAFPGAAEAAAEVDRWLAHFRARGIRAVSSGFIILRRVDSGESWTRTESRASTGIHPEAGEEIRRLFDNESWLRTAPDEATLLDSLYQVPDGISAVMNTTLGNAGWQNLSIRLTSPGRVAYDGPVDENLLRLLEMIRAGQPPRAMVEELRAKPEFAGITVLESQIAGLTRELVRYALIQRYIAA